MSRIYELELASLRSEWQELDHACDELPEGLHVQGLIHLAMTRLDDRIRVLERNVVALQHGAR
jgi:hypothetical protein